MAIELQWEIDMPKDLEGLEALLNTVAEACFRTEGIEGTGFAVRIVDDAALQALSRIKVPRGANAGVVQHQRVELVEVEDHGSLLPRLVKERSDLLL